MARKAQTAQERYNRTGRNPEKLCREIDRTARERGIEVEWRHKSSSHKIVSTDLGSVPIPQGKELSKGTFGAILRQLIAIGLGCFLIAAIVVFLA